MAEQFYDITPASNLCEFAGWERMPINLWRLLAPANFLVPVWRLGVLPSIPLIIT